MTSFWEVVMIISNSSLSKQAYVFGIILSVSVYYGTMYYFSYNMPYLDDYDAILAFMNNYIDAHDVMSRLQLIFSQKNEHRLGFTHIITLLQYKITGSVSFVLINAVGNMALLVIYFIFLDIIRNNHRAPDSMTDHGLLAMITSFLLFNFSFFILLTWAMGSTSQLWCFAFSLMMCHFITKAGGFYIALIAGMGAVICQGNGLFVLIVGLWYLMCNKQWCKATILIIVTLSSFYLYFSGNTWKVESVSSLQFPQRFLSMGAYFFTFIGSLFSISHSRLNMPGVLTVVPTMCGAIMLSIFIYLTIAEKRVFRPGSIHLFVAFLVITGLAVAFSRIHLGIEQATAVRYKIVSTLFLICIVYLMYDYFVSSKYGKKISIVFCLGSILLWTTSLIYIYPLSIHVRVLRQPIANQYYNWYIESYERSINILLEAEEKRIFKPPLHYK